MNEVFHKIEFFGYYVEPYNNSAPFYRMHYHFIEF